MNIRMAAVAACALALGASTARADTVTVTVTGVVAPVIIGPTYTTTYGIDFGGFFGPAGGNLAGQPFTVVWTGIDCNCTGIKDVFDPIIDAVLTINGHSYDFGAGLPDLFAYNSFRDTDREVTIGHMETSNGGLSFHPSMDGHLGTSYAGAGTLGRDGDFSLQLGSNTANWTQGYLTIDTVAVPGPVVGAGLPGLVLAFGGVAAWWRRRRSLPDHSPTVSAPAYLGVS